VTPFVVLVSVVAIACAAEVYGSLTRSLIEAGTRDPLTGLRNRSGLQLASRSIWARLVRSHGVVTVAAIDLDRFKAFNDTYGHGEGDRLLETLADAWTGHVPPDAVLARTGGDEFVLVLPGMDSRQAHAVLCSLDRSHPAPLSFGIATGTAESTLGALWGEADAALYNAKSRRTH
jgi:diguanylate cyclase (GGDEF)-like protein